MKKIICDTCGKELVINKYDKYFKYYQITRHYKESTTDEYTLIDMKDTNEFCCDNCLIESINKGNMP